MKICDLKDTIEKLLSGSGKNPIVVFTAAWPFLRALEAPPKDIPQLLLDLLREIAGDRDLVMPTFTRGYKDGVCNLDEEKSLTGIVSDMLRQLPESRRSLSAFFSFSIIGPGAGELVGLKPENGWGDHSTYDWMEKRNASFLMVGTHPTHCSYLHRMEWLAREHINYRYVKTFNGTIIRDGEHHDMVENLYVRCLEPNMVNDFTNIFDLLLAGGMEVVKLDRISIAHMNAANMKESFLAALLKDPYISVKNREDFEPNDRPIYQASH